MEKTSVKCRKPQLTAYTFEGFMRPPALVLGAIGLVFWPNTSYCANKWQGLRFIITIFSVSLAIISQVCCGIEFFIESKNFIEGTELMIYLLYAILSEIKILCVFKNLKRINKLISTLNDLFPVTKQQMTAFNVEKYHRKVLLLTIPVTFVMWFNVSFFSIITFVFFLKTEPDNLDSVLQFYFWYPFEVNTPTRFIGAFIQQVHASQAVTLCVLGSDALLTCILLQVCMHLDELSSRLEKKQTGAGDIKDLSAIIHQHDVILRLMDEVNEIFASPVFITFLSSAFVMCFVEFQVAIGASGVHILKFVLFLMYEVLKIFQTSVLGDMLMEASLNIGEAAYRSNWYESSVQYQKVILMIVWRAQKQANLNAITLHEVCLITFKEIISKSYTFFTLLRTMYTN